MLDSEHSYTPFTSVKVDRFGVYGRLSVFGCKAPFDQHPSVSGDLPECVAYPFLAADFRSFPWFDEEERNFIERSLALVPYFFARSRMPPDQASRMASTKAVLEPCLAAAFLALAFGVTASPTIELKD